MRNLKLVVNILGHLLLYEALMMLVCLGIAIYFGEDDILAFSCSVVITVIVAILMRYFSRNAQNRLTRRDSFLVVSLAWIMFSVFGTLPYIISGYIPSFSDAFFEAISNFTTTGLSTYNVSMPHGLLFWRSLAQWVGGLGIVFFTIAILPSFADGDVKVFAAESTGPTKTRLHPRLKIDTRWIWLIYISLTLACAVCYYLAGMDIFDSLNFSMVTSGTGGHSPYADGLAHFSNTAVDYIAIVFMLLGGINFGILYAIFFQFNFKRFFRNSEAKLYIGMIIAISIFVCIILLTKCNYTFEHAFRSSLFEVVSILSSTGLYSDDIMVWPQSIRFILVFCMIIGGCAGSTSGGVKVIRVVMLLKNMKNEFRRILHPNAILSLRVNGGVISNSIQATLSAFITMFVIIVITSSIIFVAMGMEMDAAFSMTVSCISNCGPTFGPEIDTAMGWDIMPTFGKWLCSALMLIGRLEIFSVLIIFTKNFWKDN